MSKFNVVGLLPLVLCACGGEEDPSRIPITVEIEDDDAVDLAIGPASGEGELYLPVRGINQHNAALPNVDATLSFEGSGLNNNGATVNTGAWGIAEVRLWSSTAQHVRISAPDFPTASGEIAGGDAWLLPEAWDPQSLSPAQALQGPPSHVVGTDNATLYSVGSDIYWQAHNTGADPQHSASLNGEALGLLATDLDDDGHTDAVAWSASEILLLRGSSLGLVWGGGFSMSEGAIVDVASDAIDDDSFPDLAIAYTNVDAPGVQVLLNDGAWGFDPLVRLGLASDPESLTVGQFLGNQSHELAILQQGDIVRYRYDADEDRWLNSGQDLAPEPGFGPGAELGLSEDIGGEGADELFIVEAPVDSGERRLAFYELNHERPLIYDLRFEANEYLLGDATGDGIKDVLVLQDDGAGRAELRALTSDVDGEDPYRNRSFSTLSNVGVLSLHDQNGDGVADLTVTDEAIRHHLGRAPEPGYWAVQDPGIGGWDMSAGGKAMLIDANKDGKKLDLLIIRDVSGQTSLWSYTFAGGQDGADLNLVKNPTFQRNLDNKNTADRASFLDWDLCDSGGQFIYMLVDDGGTWLFVTKIQTNGSVPGRADVAVRADRVTCGDFSNGASVAAVSFAGEVNYFDDALNPLGTENIGPISDVVAADLDGSGVQLIGCSGNCSLAAADTDGDGIDEIAYGGDNAGFSGWGESMDLATTGSPAFSDVDGNGSLDLIFTSPTTGHFEIYPIIDGSIAPARAWHTRQSIAEDVVGGDVDADGLAEFFLISATGDLLIASQD